MSSNEFPTRRDSDADLEDGAIRRFQQLVIGFPHLKPTFYQILVANGFDLVRGLQSLGLEVLGGAPLTPAHMTTIAGLLDHWALTARGLYVENQDSDSSSYSSGDVASDYSGSASVPPHLAPTEVQGSYAQSGTGSFSSGGGGKRPSGSEEF
jgi:hypothetical protein